MNRSKKYRIPFLLLIFALVLPLSACHVFSRREEIIRDLNVQGWWINPDNALFLAANPLEGKAALKVYSPETAPSYYLKADGVAEVYILDAERGEWETIHLRYSRREDSVMLFDTMGAVYTRLPYPKNYDTLLVPCPKGTIARLLAQPLETSHPVDSLRASQLERLRARAGEPIYRLYVRRFD